MAIAIFGYTVYLRNSLTRLATSNGIQIGRSPLALRLRPAGTHRDGQQESGLTTP